VNGAVEKYHTNPQKFSEIDNNFWDDTEKGLIQKNS
jgi:hypothetical protein